MFLVLADDGFLGFKGRKVMEFPDAQLFDDKAAARSAALQAEIDHEYVTMLENVNDYKGYTDGE